MTRICRIIMLWLLATAVWLPWSPPALAQDSPQAALFKIEPASLQVIYVPTYNPTVVYGAWPYPAYPPYAYYPPGYVAATSFMSFGVGVLDA